MKEEKVKITHIISSSHGNCRFLAAKSFGILGNSLFISTKASLPLFSGNVEAFLIDVEAIEVEVEALGSGFDPRIVLGSRAAMIAFLRRSAAVSPTTASTSMGFALVLVLSDQLCSLQMSVTGRNAYCSGEGDQSIRLEEEGSSSSSSHFLVNELTFDSVLP